MSNLGFKITVEGRSIKSGDARDYVLWSKHPELKITKQESGFINIPLNDFTATKEIAHGLGYIPGFMSYYKYPGSDFWWVDKTALGGLSSYSAYDSGTRANKTNIYLTVDRGDSGETASVNVPFNYILFDQPGGQNLEGNDRPTGYTPSNVGVKVTPPGVDARTAKLYQQQFNSNTNYLKYHKTFTGVLNWDTTASGADEDKIQHGLPYAPLFMVYARSQLVDTFYNTVPVGRVPGPFATSAGVDAENLVVETIWAGAVGPPSSGTIDYRAIIFKNRMEV